jgi:hypothetical protein
MAHSRPPASEVNRGDVAGAISSYFGVAAGAPGVEELLKDVFPEIRTAAALDPASWKSVFPGVMAKFETKAKELGLGVSPFHRDLDILRSANVGDANFAAAAIGGNTVVRRAPRHVFAVKEVSGTSSV